MTKPRTAGKVLTEEEVRAYMKCNKFYAFGGKYKAELRTLICQRAYERMLAVLIRNPDKDFSVAMSKSIAESMTHYKVFQNHLEGDSIKIRNECTVALNEVFRTVPLTRYVPVSGHFTFRAKVLRTPIDLSVSGILKLGNGSYKLAHIIDFSPYNNQHAMQWDVITHLKVEALKRITPYSPNRIYYAKVHSFSVSEATGKLYYATLDNTQVNKELLRTAGNIISSMENNVELPLVPCPYACPYKQRCRPS